MKNSSVRYLVRTIENYPDNQGNADVYTVEYNTLKEAKIVYRKKLSEPYKVNGKYCIVQLLIISTPKDFEEVILESEIMLPGLLPENGVVVTYRHTKYIGYAYDIVDVREVKKGERYIDLHPDTEQAYRCVDEVYDSVYELEKSFLNGISAPLDKIHSGSDKIREFLNLL